MKKLIAIVLLTIVSVITGVMIKSTNDVEIHRSENLSWKLIHSHKEVTTYHHADNGKAWLIFEDGCYMETDDWFADC